MTENADRVLNGRYRIEALIGRGGMADVYRGHDLSLNRVVAVKMLRPDLARDPMFQTRFRREAQSSASLNHANIVGVYDTGQAEITENGHEVTAPFIVMEHVPGVTLRHIMHGTPQAESTGGTPAPPPPPGGETQRTTPVPSGEEPDPQTSPEPSTQPGMPPGTADTANTQPVTGGDVLGVTDDDAPTAPDISGPLQEKIDHALGKPLTEQEAAGYLSGVLGALSYSHTKGIVHRDIKPSNVMVSNSGDVKVMDFGIARALADSAQTMTQTSSVVGTAQYLSPEQARGEVVDHRSDLYSAGCVLFELLTNRPPFIGESPVSVAYQHVREEPPMVSDFNNLVSPAMESVVAKALVKDPAQRFQSAEEFDHALQNALRGIPVDDAPTAAMSPVGQRSSFDELVGAGTGAAAVGTPLSARTPEDPDIDDYYTDYRRPPRRRAVWLVLLGLLLIGTVVGATFFLTRTMNTTDGSTVPDVAGMARSEAWGELTDAGLRPQIEEQAHEEIEADHAIGTDPAADEEVAEGEEVTLFISTGQEDITIPGDLQGQSEDAVRNVLEQLGLEIGDVTEEDHESLGSGELISTEPTAGTAVPPGTEVNLVLSTGMTELPGGLVGSWRSNAEETLGNAGFTTQLQWEQTEDAEFDGEVLRLEVEGEEVSAGESVPNGATVVIVAAYSEESQDEEDDEEDSGDSEEENSDGGEENGDDATDDPSPSEEETDGGNGDGENGNGGGNGGGNGEETGDGGNGNGNGENGDGGGNGGNGNGNGNGNQDEG